MKPRLTDQERAYLSGFWDYLLNHAGLPDGATDQACIDAVEQADHGPHFSMKGRSGHDLYFAYLEADDEAR